MTQKVYLMDGSGYIFRAFYALPRLTTRSGIPTNALYGFATMLLKLLRQEPEGLVVAFEPGGPNFRHGLAPTYKAQRPEIPEELRLQFPLCRELVDLMGVRTLSADGFEADDVIATLCDRALAWGLEPVLLTSDKDLMQLVSDRVHMIDPIGERPFGPDEVRAKLGVGPEQVIDLLALAGDASDNVPGIPGIGLKTAAKLLEEHGNLDTLLAQAAMVKGKRGETLRASRDAALLSRALVTLRHDVPLEIDPGDLRPRTPELLVLEERLLAWELHGLLRTLPAAWTAELARLKAEREVPPSITATAPEVTAPAWEVRRLQTEGELTELLEGLSRTARFALRTTSRTDPGLPPAPTGLALAWQPGAAVFVDLDPAHERAGLPAAAVLERLAPLLADPAVPKLAHDHKRDHQILTQRGIDLRGVVGDPLLASYLLEPERRTPTLAELTLHHLRRQLHVAPAEVDPPPGTTRKLWGDAGPPPDEVARSAGEEALAVLELSSRLATHLGAAGMERVYQEVELPLTRVLSRLELRGICLDAALLREMSSRFAEQLVGLEQECHRLAGCPFLISSPKQLAEILFDKLQLPQTKKTKTARSTDQSVLEELAAIHPLPEKILEYRQLAKLKSTYLDTLPRLLHPDTGRLHTSLNQAVAATGRLSSTEPNLQNIPVRTEEGRRIRTAFVAGPGAILLSADYSQIELRVLAHMAGEPTLVEAFRRGDDIHAATAAELFGLLPGLVSPEQRRAAKAINFGILYGMSAFRLAREQSMTRTQAQRFIDQYFQRYSRVKGWIDENLAVVRERGYTETLLGRRRPIPGLRERNHAARSAAERVATNTPIQGSAADIIKIAMVRLQDLEDRGQLDAPLLLQVHDELLFELPEEQAETRGAQIKTVMEQALELRVPLEVEIGRGRSWAEAH